MNFFKVMMKTGCAALLVCLCTLNANAHENSLENTTWNVKYAFSNNAFIFNFLPNNIVVVTAPNGQVSERYWDETEDGQFTVLSPRSTTNPDIWTVLSGTYFNDVGQGYYYAYTFNKPTKFTMKKQ